MRSMALTKRYLITKRLLDVTLTGCSLVVLSPLIGLVAASVRLRLGSPIFYGQLRIGLDHRPFRLWKFRTMTQDRDADGTLLPDAARLTPLGRMLRETSLDELPQLINVLRGEMSLVGPRPLLVRYIPRYSERQRLRHKAKPGITGWAQVNGRNLIDWDSKLELDVWYAEHASLSLDLQILARTLLIVLQRGGVLSGAGAELDEFWGKAGAPAEGPRAFPVEENESLPS